MTPHHFEVQRERITFLNAAPRDGLKQPFHRNEVLL